MIDARELDDDGAFEHPELEHLHWLAAREEDTAVVGHDGPSELDMRASLSASLTERNVFTQKSSEVSYA